MNTKERHLEILNAAKSELEKRGGVETVDNLENPERLTMLRHMYKAVVEDTNCHYDTAKRNVAKAMRLARGVIVKSRWGGNRGGGRPPKETHVTAD